MACILEKFRNSINKDITSKEIWDHLDTMYDMQALVRFPKKFINFIIELSVSTFWVNIPSFLERGQYNIGDRKAFLRSSG
jgi:hypothetical protein